jgi:hypothetical protein
MAKTHALSSERIVATEVRDFLVLAVTSIFRGAHLSATVQANANKKTHRRVRHVPDAADASTKRASQINIRSSSRCSPG